MTEIRYVLPGDREFWFTLDRHISAAEFEKKIRDREGYVAICDGASAGILRYNLFWDNTPFCNMLFVGWEHRRKGLGRMLMERWESDMRAAGYEFVLTSTQSDETAQHFYRKLGYSDCGALILNGGPAEIFLMKRL